MVSHCSSISKYPIFLSSYSWVLRVNKIEEWEGYFKPLSFVQLLVLVTVLIVLLQVSVFCSLGLPMQIKVTEVGDEVMILFSQ